MWTNVHFRTFRETSTSEHPARHLPQNVHGASYYTTSKKTSVLEYSGRFPSRNFLVGLYLKTSWQVSAKNHLRRRLPHNIWGGPSLRRSRDPCLRTKKPCLISSRKRSTSEHPKSTLPQKIQGSFYFRTSRNAHLGTLRDVPAYRKSREVCISESSGRPLPQNI